MGADLCIAYLGISEKKNNEKGLKEIQNKMIKAVEKLGVKDYGEVLAIMEDYSKDDEIQEEIDKEETDLREKIVNSLNKEINKERYMECAKKILKEVIEKTFGSLHNRDVAEIYHKGDMLFLSGGMSWGDEPTDTYGVFNKFLLLPKKVLEAGGIK